MVSSKIWGKSFGRKNYFLIRRKIEAYRPLHHHHPYLVWILTANSSQLLFFPRAGIRKLQPTGQVKPTTCFYQWSFPGTWPCPLMIYVWSMVASPITEELKLQWRLYGLTKSKIFALWPFMEPANSYSRAILSSRNIVWSRCKPLHI